MATDRTKTEEEIALEEKEKLEKAERARKRRMEGLDSESEDEGRHHRHNKRRKGAPQGDDLDDDYLEELEDEVNQLGKGLTLQDIQNGALDPDMDEGSEDEDEDDEDDEEGSDEEDDEDEEDDDDGESDYGDLEDDEDEEIPEFGDDDDDYMNEFGSGGNISKAKTKTKSSTSQKGESTEIPFTFECPSTHDEFLTIMSELTLTATPTVVKRIRVLYHPKLSADNKAKMTTFLGVLVDHIGYLASTESPLPQKVIESLMKHVFEISQQLPEGAGSVFLGKLKQMQKVMAQKVSQQQGSAFPDVEDIAILRCLGKVFPTSDLKHPVASPAMLYICQALELCRVHTEIDLGRGLFLVLLMHEVTFKDYA